MIIIRIIGTRIKRQGQVQKSILVVSQVFITFIIIEIESKGQRLMIHSLNGRIIHQQQDEAEDILKRMIIRYT